MLSAMHRKGIPMKLVLPLLACLTLAGCAKPTEEQRLEKFRRSIRYRTYRFASEKAVGFSVAEYNKRTTPPVDEDLVHAILSLVWFVGKKNEMSFVEADIAAAGASEETRMHSLGLQSVSLGGMECPRLAAEHYDRYKAELAGRQGVDQVEVEIEHKVALLGMILVSLYHGDPALAVTAADSLGAISQVDYLPPLVGAIAEAKQGNHLKAVEELRELSKSERFAEHRRFLLEELADIIEKSADEEELERELEDRLLPELLDRLFDDIFSTEAQQALLEETRALADRITGREEDRPPADADGEQPENGNPEEPE
jgi:hypothetical protein